MDSPTPHTTHPPHLQCILTPKTVDLDGMRGCHRKLWENVMDVVVKIEKTKTDKDKNVGE